MMLLIKACQNSCICTYATYALPVLSSLVHVNSRDQKISYEESDSET